jgi:negative regulator of flagellin synthesis FlgM
MKINQNVTFLKNEMPAPVMTTGKTSSAVGGAADPAQAVAIQARLPVTSGDFDAAHVAKIRESIHAGDYKVNTAKIADGLISSVRDLIGKNPT